MSCPACGGLLVIEPALAHCTSCGREYPKPRASDTDLARQRALDLAYQAPSEAAEFLLEELAEIEESEECGRKETRSQPE